MPPRRSSTPPPSVMTWGKAMPVLIVGAVFDILRFMCEWLIFFGPALSALYCNVSYSSTVGASVCTAVAGATTAAVGFAFGLILAMAVGFAGWLVVGIWLLATNSRIFKENLLWFGAALLVSEVPFVSSVPAITVSLIKMYRTQIRTERAALKQFQATQAAEEQARATQAAQQQVREVQAANDAAYEIEAANEASYEQDLEDQELEGQESVDQNAQVLESPTTTKEIPEDIRKAA